MVRVLQFNMAFTIKSNEVKEGIEYNIFDIEYNTESAKFKREDLHVGPDNERIIVIKSRYKNEEEVYRLVDKFKPVEPGELEDYPDVEEVFEEEIELKLIGRESPNIKDLTLNSIQSIKRKL